MAFLGLIGVGSLPASVSLDGLKGREGTALDSLLHTLAFDPQRLALDRVFATTLVAFNMYPITQCFFPLHCISTVT